MTRKKVIVAGASGLVGGAALTRFTNRDDWEVIAVSRRPPLVPLGNARHLSIDLSDRDECARVFGEIHDVTHIAYAALNERSDDLIAGWSDPSQIEKNESMLVNLVDPVIQGNPRLQHILLLQGGKAYGVHLPDHDLKVPLQEDAPRHPGENFYYRQQDYIADLQSGASWSWTILRTGGIWGAAVGANMNTFLVVALFAALRKEAGLDMPVPSGFSGYMEPTDVDLIAEAIEWAGQAPTARNQIFNITNGDILASHDVFEMIARELGMAVGEKRPIDLGQEIGALAHLWPTMVEKYGLRVTSDLNELLGTSLQIAGVLSRDFPPEEAVRWGLLSTIKIRKAGFHSCMSSEESVKNNISKYQNLNVLPR